MSRFTKFASAVAFAAAFAPFAAQARSADLRSTYPAQHLVRISDAQAPHGRAATANVQPDFAIAPGATQLANTGHNAGFTG